MVNEITDFCDSSDQQTQLFFNCCSVNQKLNLQNYKIEENSANAVVAKQNFVKEIKHLSKEVLKTDYCYNQLLLNS